MSRRVGPPEIDISQGLPPEYWMVTANLGRIAMATLPTRDENWSQRAACRDEDPELFFAPGEGWVAADEPQIDEAKAVCRRCEVAGDCLMWAFQTGDKHAIMGLTTPDERSRPRQYRRYIPLGVDLRGKVA